MPHNQVYTVFENCIVRGDWEDLTAGSGLAVVVKKANDDKNSIIVLCPRLDGSDIYFSFQKGAKINISGNVLIYNENDASQISSDEYKTRCNY